MPAAKITSTILLKELERMGYTFRLNIMNDSLEVAGVLITDPIRAEIKTSLRDLGYGRYLTAAEDAYLADGYKKSYHPIREYLDNLQWDGLDHINDLASYFTESQNGCNANQPVFEIFFNRWIVGAVAKCLDSKQNAMLVIDGPQGIGKSHFVRWLASCFSPQFFIEKSITADKDDEVRLISTMIWEVAELGATARRTDREMLKHFISQRTVTVRKPYGHYDVHKPALANLIGTINDEAGFLSDPTGNRRFLVCTIKSIDWDYMQDIDLYQVWAQVVNKYKTGQESEHITDEEIKLQECLNEKYMIDDPFLIGLQQKCRADPDDHNTWASSNDILIFLGYDPPRRADTMALGSAAKKLGLKKGNDKLTNKIRGYFGVNIP